MTFVFAAALGASFLVLAALTVQKVRTARAIYTWHERE